MTRNYYRLKEYSSRADLAIDDEDARQLAGQFANQLEISPALDQPGHYQLRAFQYVGTIALSRTTIIIEPKTPIANLAHMLATVYNLVRWQPVTSRLSATSGVLDLIVTAFINSTLELIEGGLKQGYQDVTENISLVRGQIDFAGQLLENIGQPTRHKCTFADLSANILENQILKLALARLETFELPPQLSWQQARVANGLAGVSLPPPAMVARDWPNLTFTRLNEHYRLPLAFAQLIIEATSPTWQAPSGQQCHWPACLVDMNRLFERYVAQRLQSISNNNPPLPAISDSNPVATNYLAVRYQTQVHLDQQAQHSLRPDLVVMSGEQVVAVIDTKYKLAYEATDYYQMISYCIVLAVDRAILVYPAWQPNQRGPRERAVIEVKNSDIKIEIAPIELAGSIAALDQSIDRLLIGLGAR